ncbi:16S rRNA (uracil(1498)-N(3))-methyltransferase [Massiliimalia timonensis]|uniref:16S rRNA (uracil(1498)-N(3))-methyltransferase n=1 Tax=Massiliimalia timonensis TaxID=1987501 RepID=UPI00189E60F1|nr:16S rRNA (uracil(1498)-N(3))-methyltransferase [Massiliimalia timonensis]
MPKFFCERKEGENLYIEGEDAKHISRVLRMGPGETITVSCPDGFDYEGVLQSCGENLATAKITRSYPNQSEPSVKIILYQALPKGDKFDLITQKAVELGVTKIVPVLTKRCVSRPDEKAMKKKIARWQKIAKEAAKQSGRGIIPEVGSLVDMKQAINLMTEEELAILFYEGGGRRLNELVPSDAQKIAILIGSEGGFEEEEVNDAKKQGIFVATLGKLILRCETAPLAALAILMNLTENI